MIKLPDAIVIYPQKKSVPDYLLCWIPANEYRRVVQKPEKRAELEKLYPRGIEIELSEEGLQETGISLEVTPEQLQQAYLELLEEDLVPDTGMVELSALKEYLDEKERRSREELSSGLTDRMGRFEELDEGDLLRKIRTPPPMSEGDEPWQVYRRLDVKRRQTDRGEEGE